MAKTIIIAGINGDMGTEFARRLEGHGKIYGISRKDKKIKNIVYSHVKVNLLNAEDVKNVFPSLSLSDNIIYIHLPGKFRFQDENHPIIDRDTDGIDDNIFTTNVKTFRGIKPFLLEHLIKNPNTTLKIVGIGSTSDLYDIPYWHSFTQSKNELRKEFRSLFGNHKIFGRVSSLFINVSTVDGKQLVRERPYISKTYVLTPKEILDKTFPYLIREDSDSIEVSVIKSNPAFERDDFLACDQIKKRWYQDMYDN